MDWGAKIYNYCERGGDAAFWAEPLNAVSNAAFIIAALFATREFLSRPSGQRRAAEAGLILLVYVIGIGSFLFHTYATRWAAIADTAPIGLFMLAYFAYALRRYLGLHWVLVLLGVGAFVASLQYARGIQCRPEFLPITAKASARCLNGTVAYSPAFVALALIAVAPDGGSARGVDVPGGGGRCVPRRDDVADARFRTLSFGASR